jgi:hypothetical protein
MAYPQPREWLSFVVCSVALDSSSTGSGGIYVQVGDGTYRDCIFSGNTGNYGPALQLLSGNHKIRSCVFSHNTAEFGD